MFLYYHRKQNKKNESYYKGKLFEILLKRYLEASGFDVELRQKHNSLEYDIEGQDRTTKMKIVGEAKALTASVSAPVFTSFVGKLLPLGLIERNIKGLFLSTASLTPEANDYYRSVTDLGIIAYTGEDLQKKIKTTLNSPNFEPLSKQLIKQGYVPQQGHVLVTENHIFTVVTAGSNVSVTPAHFAVFQDNGELLSDEMFSNELAEKVSELTSLAPILAKRRSSFKSERVIRKGLIVGDNWTDYRFPAAPEFFVGRESLIKRLLNYISLDRPPDSNVLQIKSRSGVGKSSTLAFLENELSKRGYTTELHDARDVKSILDIYSITQRFTESSSSPMDFKAIETQLDSLRERIGESRAVFMVDQFESTFTSPEVFQAYESLAALFHKYSPNLWICFARKNDQITTYDDSKISLDRLNSFSKSFELKDFTKSEAFELLHKANSVALKPVSKGVLAYVLEFAQGFPWLVKRTIAHVTGLSEKTKQQGELFASVLRLEDLFDEELEGLDEIEREYLTKIAARLPADFNQLQNLFDEDPLLPKILDKLTQSRLLRLSGFTYDTYNDVFKEYLVYHKLPEFKQAIIYRNAPITTLRSFPWAVSREKFTVEEFEAKLNLSRGSTFNRIGELGAVNLIRRDNGDWIVPRTVIDVFNQGRLGEYLRSQLVDNPIVSTLLNRIAQNEVIRIDDIPRYLEDQFPFIEASEKTWKKYAHALISWLEATKLTEFDEDILVLPAMERKLIVEGLGNLSKLKGRSGRGRRSYLKDRGLFLPNSNWTKFERVLKRILNNETPSAQDLKKVKTDLRTLGCYEDGKLKVKSFDELKTHIKKVLAIAPYSRLWKAAKKNEDLIHVLKQIVQADHSLETYKWRLKVLISWAKGIDILDKTKRYRAKGKSK